MHHTPPDAESVVVRAIRARSPEARLAECVASSDAL
jgi:hypothetical protein